MIALPSHGLVVTAVHYEINCEVWCTLHMFSGKLELMPSFQFPLIQALLHPHTNYSHWVTDCFCELEGHGTMCVRPRFMFVKLKRGGLYLLKDFISDDW